MKKLLVLFLLSPIVFAETSLTNTLKIQSELATIYNTEEFLIQGPAKRIFRIQVSYPHDPIPGINIMKTGLKPVPVYVIDGGYAFGMFSNIARYLQWGGLVPTMVIGIGYEDEIAAGEIYRMHDLTPPDKNFISPWDENLRSESVGGGPDFREFLINTLKPIIESRFEVDSTKSVLVGHSFGGLFALNTMLETPSAFSGILSISPSIWFAECRILNKLTTSLEESFKYQGKLAVYVGGREEDIAGKKFKMTSNVDALNTIIANNKNSFFDYDIRIYPDRTHHNILGQAATEGLEFLLSE